MATKKSEFNPGRVNIEHVIETGDGVTSKRCKSGDIHTTVYTREGQRISWNEGLDGSIRDVHSTNKDGKHVTYKDAC